MNTHLKNILVVNVNWLGDVIFSSPVFFNLKQAYPQAQLTCLCVPRVVDILKGVPYIDKIMIYDEKGQDRWPWAKGRVLQAMRREKFDAVFFLHGSWSRALLAWLAGIPIRVGYATKKGKRLLTHSAAMPDGEIHKSDFYLGVLQILGIPISDRTCRLTVDEQSQIELEQLLKKAGVDPTEKYVVLHTSGNWHLKRWPQVNWAELIVQLKKGWPYKIIISEGPRERDWAQTIAKMSKVDPIVLAGETNLGQLMALLQKAHLVISGDSGPLHIASCVTKKMVGIYGPTVPLTTGPRGGAQAILLHQDVGCNRASCYHLSCPDNVCMQAVKVEDVLAAVRQMNDRAN